ncbi:MAG: hypothetical protein VKJ06_05075 [Vampirovibrionales bacterium]|nr:hypothetical protein [Vampirovibrionales bacterium]
MSINASAYSPQQQGLTQSLPQRPAFPLQSPYYISQVPMRLMQEWVTGPNGVPVLMTVPANVARNTAGYVWKEVDPRPNVLVAKQVVKRENPPALKCAAVTGLGFASAMELLFGHGGPVKLWIKTARAIDNLPGLAQVSALIERKIINSDKNGMFKRTLGYLSPEALTQNIIDHDVKQLISHPKIQPHLTPEMIKDLKAAKTEKDVAEVAGKWFPAFDKANKTQVVAHKWLKGMHLRYKDGLTKVLEHYKDLHAIYYPNLQPDVHARHLNRLKSLAKKLPEALKTELKSAASIAEIKASK